MCTMENFFKVVSTHLGDLTIRILAKPTVGAITENNQYSNEELIICLPGAKENLTDEWVPMCMALVEEGNYVACIINFHTNEKTKPGLIYGGLQPMDLSLIINDAISKITFKKEQFILMGKSWGGYMAMEYIALNPNKVLKACFLAPAFTTKARVQAVKAANLPVYLGWAKDDPFVWYSNSETWKKEMMENNFQFYSAETGGHTINMEYYQSMVSFLNDPIPSTTTSEGKI